MKTTVITLQGQDFVLTEPARQILMTHLRKLQKSTRFRPSSYRDNVEALRDVLIEQGGKQVTKVGIVTAIGLVGLPEKRSFNDTFLTRFPRFHRAVIKLGRPVSRLRRFIIRHWWQSVVVAVAAMAILMSTGYVFSALMMIQPTGGATAGWQVMSTSIGPVRYYNAPVDDLVNMSGWLFGWQADVLYAVIFLAVAILVLRLRRAGRLPFVFALLACGFLLLCLYSTQGQMTPNYATGVNIPAKTRPYEPHIAYLRQCGDEIQYVFDGGTDGLLFRQLRDKGFELQATIPTRESDGTIDTKALCQQYDALRRDHPKESIVLQYYAQNDDGTIRAYDYGDLGEGISSYGLFVKP